MDTMNITDEKMNQCTDVGYIWGRIFAELNATQNWYYSDKKCYAMRDSLISNNLSAILRKPLNMYNVLYTRVCKICHNYTNDYNNNIKSLMIMLSPNNLNINNIDTTMFILGLHHQNILIDKRIEKRKESQIENSKKQVQVK